MEDAMNAFEVLFTLVILRVVVPVGLLLLVGEWIQSGRRGRLHLR